MLFISSEDVARLLTVEDAPYALEGGHRDLAARRLMPLPRVDIYTETDTADRFHRWRTMEGSSKTLGRLAIRVLVFNTKSEQPLAIVNDGLLQHVSVGVLAALGGKYLAKPDPSSVARIGSGGMARSPFVAFPAARPIERAKAYIPNAENRAGSASEMEDRTGIDVIPCDSDVEAVTGVDLIPKCTSSKEATAPASTLESGMHLRKVAREWALDVLPIPMSALGGDGPSQVVQNKSVDDLMGRAAYIAGAADALGAAKGAHRHPRRRGGAEPDNSVPSSGDRVVPLAQFTAGWVRGQVSNEKIGSSGAATSTGVPGRRCPSVSRGLRALGNTLMRLETEQCNG